MNFFHTTITEEAKKLANECLNYGFLSEGKYVDAFEKEIEKEFSYKNCVALNSCTSALHLALVLAGVKAGDEVILPAQTFIATGFAVLQCGAKPVFADIDKETGNIDFRDAARKVNQRTQAIICVSWGGTPCDFDTGWEYWRAFNGLSLIQDNAHALGSTYKGEPVSNFGTFSCFSFQAIKQLTTGDGGMLTCKNPHDYYRAKKLRWFGIDRENDKTGFDGERVYDAHEVGYKYHMNNIAAAIGLGNLHGVKERQARRKWVADNYQGSFPRLENIVSREGSSDWLFTALVDNRDNFIRMMRSKDIPVSVVHNGIDRNSIFGGIDRSLVNQRYWDEHHICLPCHSGLTDEDVQKVCDAIRGGW